MTTDQMPKRDGPRPDVIGPRPHAQRSQTAPPEFQDELIRRVLGLPGVSEAESVVSVPGARAFVLDEASARGPSEAFQADREFAHIHPPDDGSLHMTLPRDVADAAYAAGWGEPHPISGTPLIFGPRTEAELEVVWSLLRSSYEYASGGGRDRGEEVNNGERHI
jgi:phospholipase/carboxylesterase